MWGVVLEGDKRGLRIGVWDVVVVLILKWFCLNLIGRLKGFFGKREVLELEGEWGEVIELIKWWDIIVVIFYNNNN